MFEGLKRAVMRIDNDFWKRQQEERHKFQATRAIQGYIPKAPRPTQERPSPTLESPTLTNKLPRDRTRGLLSQAPSSSYSEQPPCHDLAKRLSHYLYFFSFLFFFFGLTTTRWSMGKYHVTLSQCHNGVTDGHRWSCHKSQSQGVT